MTLAEEKALLARFAKGAGGEMLNIPDLKAAYCTGRWRKLMPRPFHPKGDLAAQNALKSGFPDAVSRAPRVAARRGRRLRIMFTDEARFGRRIDCAGAGRRLAHDLVSPSNSSLHHLLALYRQLSLM